VVSVALVQLTRGPGLSGPGSLVSVARAIQSLRIAEVAHPFGGRRTAAEFDTCARLSPTYRGSRPKRSSSTVQAAWNRP